MLLKITPSDCTSTKDLSLWILKTQPFHPHQEILLFLFYHLLKSANLLNLFSYYHETLPTDLLLVKVTSFYLNPFTYAYHLDNAKCNAGIRLDNILFQDVIQPQTNRENYDSEIFKQAENENNIKCTI